ncbi:ABC transporter substrate-binding protein [Cellulomonas aerilata]|uniref:ABC transporter substrate-binding protein n=1 Tax=Cellulomonas aerilata TaxID=515326 RepID=A0A512D8X0_9CELL|nr:extracellular solute-binding protein [Cellulomonas aerilata]GEO32730.1 ABC transporter substrate-binding protein [Cellulomonas aerilata]
MRATRPLHLIASVATLGLLLGACSAPNADAPAAPAESAAAGDVPETPSAAVDLNILDVGGVQKVMGAAIEDFAEENPDIVSSVTFETGGAPDLVGTLKPQVDTGNLSIDLVLTGNDGLSSGITEDLWVPLVDDFGDRLGNQENYIEPAAAMQELAQNYGVLLTWTPGGPLISYNPDAVPEADVPANPEEILAWAKANPGKFGYARPANSGPGRTWLQGLPYILGDSDPKDPENGWDNTWAYLKELGQYVDNYPTGTGQVITNISDGTWSMTPITMGWDIEPRVDGRAPNTLEVATMDEFTWISDSHFAVMPKGLSADKQSAILLMLNDLLTPEQNAKAYDNGYLYPGPSIEGATLDKAPQEIQDEISEFGRDWYDAEIEDHTIETQLDAESIVKAFDIWDREVGAGKFEAQ